MPLHLVGAIAASASAPTDAAVFFAAIEVADFRYLHFLEVNKQLFLPSSRCIGSSRRADPARGGAAGDVQEAAGGGEGLQQVSHSDQERRGPQAAGRRRPGEQAGGGQEGGRRGEEEV